ncbi:MAG: cadherin-like domain-containing protein [Pseudomonadota bacterium]
MGCDKDYSFSAFTESDMLAAGAGSGNFLKNGETITMPGAASATLTVSDNDSRLSGDSNCNENANDHSGQTAGISVDGEEAGNGGQIYAECYYWLRDAAGNWYLLIEIEQEGTGDNYFTFCDAYGCGVPAAGTELTVYCRGNVSCWEPSYDCLGAGQTAAVNAAPVAADDAFATESDMSLSGDLLANDSDADGDALTLSGVSFGEVGVAAEVSTDSGDFTGTLTVNADGSFDFEPGAALMGLTVGESETVTFTYEIVDEAGEAASASVTITIDGVNEKPVANDDQITIYEGERTGDGDSADILFNLLANDTDAENDGLTVTAVEGGAVDESISIVTEGGRTVQFTLQADGDVIFDSAFDFNALNDGDSDSFTFSYTVSDANGGSATAVATYTVAGKDGGYDGEMPEEEDFGFGGSAEGLAGFASELMG